MTPEEQCDRLAEHRERRARLRLVEGSEREAALAAAEILMQHLQALVVPPAFATQLEARVRARARNLAPQPGKVIRFPGVQARRGSHQRTDGKRAPSPRKMRP